MTLYRKFCKLQLPKTLTPTDLLWIIYAKCNYDLTHQNITQSKLLISFRNTLAFYKRHKIEPLVKFKFRDELLLFLQETIEYLKKTQDSKNRHPTTPVKTHLCCFPRLWG